MRRLRMEGYHHFGGNPTSPGRSVQLLLVVLWAWLGRRYVDDSGKKTRWRKGRCWPSRPVSVPREGGAPGAWRCRASSPAPERGFLEGGSRNLIAPTSVPTEIRSSWRQRICGRPLASIFNTAKSCSRDTLPTVAGSTRPSSSRHEMLPYSSLALVKT